MLSFKLKLGVIFQYLKNEKECKWTSGFVQDVNENDLDICLFSREQRKCYYSQTTPYGVSELHNTTPRFMCSCMLGIKAPTVGNRHLASSFPRDLCVIQLSRQQILFSRMSSLPRSGLSSLFPVYRIIFFSYSFSAYPFLLFLQPHAYLLYIFFQGLQYHQFIQQNQE